MNSTAKVSDTGEVVLPASVGADSGWKAGNELEVIHRGSEVVLRPKSRRHDLFPPITIEEFLESIPRYEGPPITDEMIEESILKEAKRRWHAKGG